jgi:four helix bundle protein
MSDFKKLLVWHKAHAMAMNVDRIVGGIRGSRHSSLRHQTCRAADSVATNIVEGAGEQTNANFSPSFESRSIPLMSSSII